MEKLKIPFIKETPRDNSVPERAVRVKIDNNNWAKDFPYKPFMEAFLWHDGKNLHIKYVVDEEDVAAKASGDNGEVWKDSCAEFFITFDDKGYYNIESNCIGKILMSHRTGRKENVEYASPEVLASIERTASCGSHPFDTRKADGKWELKLTIPTAAFFKNNLAELNGVNARCNIYKCGDDLPKPHFLSWQPIHTPKPDFHRPEFFGEIEFEK